MTELETLQQQARRRLEQALGLQVLVPPHVYDAQDYLISTAYHAGQERAVEYIKDADVCEYTLEKKPVIRIEDLLVVLEAARNAE